MISMKKTKKEAGKDSVPVANDSKYPYGLCIRLEKEELKKLGFNELPKIGEKFVINAKAIVESVSMSAGKDNEYASGSFQITDMELENDNESRNKDTAKMMFDKMGK